MTPLIHTLREAFFLLGELYPVKGDDLQADYRNCRIKAAYTELRNLIVAEWKRDSEPSSLGSFDPIDPELGNHMTMDDWVATCQSGGFIDYDGSGVLATATEQSAIVVNPSDVTALKLPMPKWATHVVWFNR